MSQSPVLVERVAPFRRGGGGITVTEHRFQAPGRKGWLRTRGGGAGAGTATEGDATTLQNGDCSAAARYNTTGTATDRDSTL